MARGATTARISRPSALACSMASSVRRYGSSGDRCGNDSDSGRPDARIIARNVSISSSRSVRSDTTWSTPVPVAPIAAAMPTSSARAAPYDGVGAPRLLLWITEPRRAEPERAGFDRVARRCAPSPRCRRRSRGTGRRRAGP